MQMCLYTYAQIVLTRRCTKSNANVVFNQCFVLFQMNDGSSLSKSPFLSSSTNSSRTNGRSSSSSNRRAANGATFLGRRDLQQQPPMLPSDPPGTRLRHQQQLTLGGGGQQMVGGGQTIDKNWDYISGATTIGGGNYPFT